MRNQWLFLSVLFAAGCHVQAKEKADAVRFSYIPFEIETFAPVGVAEVGDVSRCRFSLDSQDPRVRVLASYFVVGSDREETFDSKVVRLKVEGLRDETFFVDKDGAFWGKNSGLAGWIPASLFQKFKSDIRRLIPFPTCGDL